MNLIFAFDIVSVFFFSLSGTITAYRYNRLDLFGLAFVGLMTAVGGGTVRDILIDAHPIAWVSNSAYIFAIGLGFICALIFMKPILKFQKPVVFIDALAVAFAAIAGLEKSLEYEVSWAAAIIFGVVTATVGGMIRDIICNEVPMVMRKEIYAFAVLVGCACYLSVLLTKPEAQSLAQGVSFSVIVSFRMLAVRFGWNLEINAFANAKDRALKTYRKKLNSNRS